METFALAMFSPKAHSSLHFHLQCLCWQSYEDQEQEVFFDGCSSHDDINDNHEPAAPPNTFHADAFQDTWQRAWRYLNGLLEGGYSQTCTVLPDPAVIQLLYLERLASPADCDADADATMERCLRPVRDLVDETRACAPESKCVYRLRAELCQPGGRVVLYMHYVQSGLPLSEIAVHTLHVDNCAWTHVHKQKLACM